MAKEISIRSLIETVEGRSQPRIPVYYLGETVKTEHPRHNPFANNPPADEEED